MRLVRRDVQQSGHIAIIWSVMHINVHTGDNHETSQSGGRRYRHIEWGNRNFRALLATAFPGHLNFP